MRTHLTVNYSVYNFSYKFNVLESKFVIVAFELFNLELKVKKSMGLKDLEPMVIKKLF